MKKGEQGRAGGAQRLLLFASVGYGILAPEVCGVGPQTVPRPAGSEIRALFVGLNMCHQIKGPLRPLPRCIRGLSKTWVPPQTSLGAPAHHKRPFVGVSHSQFSPGLSTFDKQFATKWLQERGTAQDRGRDTPTKGLMWDTASVGVHTWRPCR